MTRPTPLSIALTVVVLCGLSFAPVALAAGAPPASTRPSSPPAASAAGAGAAQKSGPTTGAAEIVVLDRVTREPVPYANLVFLDRSGGRLADGDGVFRLSDLAVGMFRVRIVHISYEPADERLEIVAGAPVHFVVALEPRAHELEVIEISAAPQVEIAHDARNQVTVTAEEAVALPNPTDDVFQLIRVLPGVSSGDVGGEFHMRGGGVDETLVRIDGLEVRQLFHGRDFGGVTGIIPYDAVEKTDVYLGGFPAEFGGRLSGVVDVALRDEGPRGFHGKFAADVVSMRAFAEMNEQAGSFFVSVREGYLHRVLEAVQNQATIQPAYRDLMLRGVLRPRPDRSLSINYLRSEDHLLYGDELNDFALDADYVDHYVWATGKFAPSNRLGLEATVHHASSTQLQHTGELDREDHHLARVGVRIQGSALLPARHFVTAGLQFDRESGFLELQASESVRISSDGDTEEVFDFQERQEISSDITSFFVQDEWAPAPRLTLNVGARGTHHSEIGELRFTPRVSGALRTARAWTWKAAWGVYEQVPQLGFEGELALRVRTDQPERAEHFIVGVERGLGRITVGLDAYDKRFHEMGGLVAHTADGELAAERVDRGRARGIEAWLNGKTARSTWWASYALGRSEWGNEAVMFVRDFDRLHSVTLAGAFAPSSAWDIGVSYNFHSGLPYTTQTWTRDEVAREWVLDEGAPYGARLPAYHRLDLRVRRHFRFSNWSMSLYAEGLNLTNHANVLWYTWRFQDQGAGRVPVRSSRTGMPGIPSFGVEVRF